MTAPRCGVWSDDGGRCVWPEGHSGQHFARGRAWPQTPPPEPRSAAAMERQPPPSAPADEELALELRRAFYSDWPGMTSLEDMAAQWLRTLARARELFGQEAARLREELTAAREQEVELRRSLDGERDAIVRWAERAIKAERERDNLAQRLFETSEDLAQARAELERRERDLRWRVSQAIDRALSDAPMERP